MWVRLRLYEDVANAAATGATLVGIGGYRVILVGFGELGDDVPSV